MERERGYVENTYLAYLKTLCTEETLDFFFSSPQYPINFTLYFRNK